MDISPPLPTEFNKESTYEWDEITTAEQLSAINRDYLNSFGEPVSERRVVHQTTSQTFMGIPKHTPIVPDSQIINGNNIVAAPKQQVLSTSSFNTRQPAATWNVMKAWEITKDVANKAVDNIKSTLAKIRGVFTITDLNRIGNQGESWGNAYTDHVANVVNAGSYMHENSLQYNKKDHIQQVIENVDIIPIKGLTDNIDEYFKRISAGYQSMYYSSLVYAKPDGKAVIEEGIWPDIRGKTMKDLDQNDVRFLIGKMPTWDGKTYYNLNVRGISIPFGLSDF